MYYRVPCGVFVSWQPSVIRKDPVEVGYIKAQAGLDIGILIGMHVKHVQYLPALS